MTKLGYYLWPWACGSGAAIKPTNKAQGPHIPALQARATQHSLQEPPPTPSPQPPEQLSLPYSITSTLLVWLGGQQRSAGDCSIFVCFTSCVVCRRALSLRRRVLPLGQETSFSSTTHWRMELTTAAHQIGRRWCSVCGYTFGKNKLDSTLHLTLIQNKIWMFKKPNQ